MLIQDRDNPTGMFSKAGRFSIEMYALLQEKDNIMNNKKKVYYPKEKKPEPEKKSTTNASSHNLNALIPTKTDMVGEPMKKKISLGELKEKQPFTKIVSRQQLDELDEKIKINNQKFGMYNPKYHFIYKKSPFYEDMDFLDEQRQSYQRHKKTMSPKVSKSPGKKKTEMTSSNTRSQKQMMMEREGSSSILSIQQSVSETNVLSPKIKGCLNFDRMAARRPFVDENGAPHEKRFEYVDLPDIYTKVKKPLNIYFQKAQKDSSMFNLKQSGLQYDINYDAIYPKTDKMIANFEKVTARKFPMKPIYTMDESQADISLYKKTEVKTPTLSDSQVLKRIPGITFKTMLAREQSATGRILPSEGI